MKRLYSYVSGLCLAGLICILSISTADAQRSRVGGGFRGGGGFHGGFRGGYHGGFGFHVYYGPGFRHYGYPRLGLYLNTLPFGYYPFYWGPDLYYYYGGTFYRPYNGGYEVTAPPVGAVVPQLPDDAHSIIIDNKQYYEFNGVYYREGVDDKGKKIYYVAGKDGVLNTDDNNTNNANNGGTNLKVGTIVYELPDGCRKVSVNGKKYFISPDGVYYEKIKDSNGNTSYLITSTPDDTKNQ